MEFSTLPECVIYSLVGQISLVITKEEQTPYSLYYLLGIAACEWYKTGQFRRNLLYNQLTSQFHVI
jgi:hypothetical protein